MWSENSKLPWQRIHIWTVLQDTIKDLSILIKFKVRNKIMKMNKMSLQTL